MTRNQLKEIVADVLEIEASDLSAEVELTTFETYDSVNVLSLIIALDEEAGIKLGPQDAAKLNTYGDIEKIALEQGVELTD